MEFIIIGMFTGIYIIIAYISSQVISRLKQMLNYLDSIESDLININTNTKKEE